MGNILGPISSIFGHIMRWFYETMSSMFAEPASISYLALSILLMAVISKLITIPIMAQMTKSSRKMKEMQPEIEKLKQKYGYDQQILQQKTMEFYKENGMSMAGCSSCLPMLLQLVLILALFAVLQDPGKYIFDNQENIHQIARNFFWIPDLFQADPLSWLGLPLWNAVLQLAVQWFGPSRQQQEQLGSGSSMLIMTFGMPIMFYFISIKWASGLLLYWTFGNVLEVIYRMISALIVNIRTPKSDDLESNRNRGKK
ncbi:MAG: YidC/Oxa1 family membrane protein insertase [Peptoniphilaceae bacterium]|nr:YidC/Oxa1 family membrane protein insertase [Peptoniphilaceae bacterium]MCI6660356.1 YidC/Oxa1 family membrane protein insertase [Peptoniphilaceae bacterium]MDD7434063.1 YidC/Oxa1 family membrane protein insertase [Peptoniphilaceae bacterium]MDY3075812.1 YidC/Oxa1 family membrane protein insertase [Peptoniphilaceae bacterium]MDY3987676.1 YidC/Oxa1 family membrane protein insertase [Peptoniphilaceae bacterium]